MMRDSSVFFCGRVFLILVLLLIYKEPFNSAPCLWALILSGAINRRHVARAQKPQLAI